MKELFLPYPGADGSESSDGRLAELHLYDGPLCNRACSFCCVAGSPSGWQQPFDEALLEYALELVSPTGCIKFYGGEPTIHPEQVIEAARFLRANGFQGSFQLFTNGILAKRVLEILDAVPGMIAVLNYSILYGRGADPIPERALELLLEHHDGRIFAGHDELNDAGSAPETPDTASAPDKGATCPHCYPVLRSDGVFHGCPFAVENLHEHFILGKMGSDRTAAESIHRFWQQIEWQREHVEPTARVSGKTACQVCKHDLDKLPSPYNKRSR